MSFSLVRLDSWNYGYLIVAVIQAVLSAGIFLSIPLWKKSAESGDDRQEEIAPAALSFREIFAIRGALPCFLSFFCYCALEVTTSLWASSYFVEKWQFSPEAAAGFASMFYIGITFGRFINGFFAMKLSDHFLIRAGCALITGGIGLLFIPVSSAFALVGFVIIGLGCAPIYPCIIHMTPDVFGKDKSQAMIGIQMAFAYTGFLIIPPLFGVIADYITISLLPVFQLALLAAMFLTHEMVVRKNKNG
jgi:fucose permease